MPKKPNGAYEKDGKVYNVHNQLIEIYNNIWCVVKNNDRSGWWRFHDHYDQFGYCDNPARGY